MRRNPPINIRYSENLSASSRNLGSVVSLITRGSSTKYTIRAGVGDVLAPVLLFGVSGSCWGNALWWFLLCSLFFCVGELAIDGVLLLSAKQVWIQDLKRDLALESVFFYLATVCCVCVHIF